MLPSEGHGLGSRCCLFKPADSQGGLATEVKDATYRGHLTTDFIPPSLAMSPCWVLGQEALIPPWPLCALKESNQGTQRRLQHRRGREVLVSYLLSSLAAPAPKLWSMLIAHSESPFPFPPFPKACHSSAHVICSMSFRTSPSPPRTR